jgi:hypothetical protein
MATDFTPEEIQRIFAEYNDAIKTGTPVTKEMADRFRDAQKGVKGFTAQMEATTKALGKSTVDFTKAMYQGAQGATAMNSAVDTLTSGIQLLINLIPGFRLAKRALTALTMAVGGATKAVNAQTEALFKSYQDMAQFGAGAAGGMRTIFDNMQKFGYGIEELDKMTALVKENSKALSSFGGTVLDGTNRFANSMTEIQRSDIGRQFQRMGYTVDDINRSGAGFIRLQQMLGQTQSSIQKNLTAGTVKYMNELDLLARITGDTREAQEAKIKEAMSEDAFAATMDELREQAAAGDASAEARINKLNLLNQTLSGDMRQEFIKAIGGDVAAAQKLMMTAPQAYQMMLDSSSSASDVMRTLVAEEKNMRGAFRGLAQLGATGDIMPKIIEQQERAAKFGDINLDDQMLRAKAEQKVTDQATKDEADRRIAVQQTRDNLQSFVNLGVAPATAALKGLAQAAAGASRAVPGQAGGGQPMGGGGGGGGGSGSSYIDRIDSKVGGPADLSGLRMKSAESTAGGSTSERLAGVARAIQNKLGGDLQYFSAFNDTYERKGNSLHPQGRALDFTLTDPSKAAAVAAMIGNIPGISYVLDEYKNASASKTGGHIHAEISAANGAILSGPRSGYRPNLTMHGTEAIVPLDSARANQIAGGSNDQMMALFSERLEEMTRKISDVADNTKKTAMYAGA